MPLRNARRPGSVDPIPTDIRAFLRQADRRIRRYHRRYRNAYPWPDEERALGQLFERHAGARVLPVTHMAARIFASVESPSNRKGNSHVAWLPMWAWHGATSTPCA